MKVFVSYAAEDRTLAEQIALALKGGDREVFWDRDSLPAGAEYHERIRAAVEGSDCVVFLVSAHSVRRGSYALTELKYTRAKWPHPKDHVLPVIVGPVDWSAIPAYLQAVTVLEPEGNVAAEVLAALSLLRGHDNPSIAIDERSRPNVSVTIEWKRRPEPDATPRRWVVYIQNSGDTAVTVETVTVDAPGRESFEIDWGTIQAHLTEDYELDESDFDPAADRPEATVRFLDSFGRRWALKGAVLTRLDDSTSRR